MSNITLDCRNIESTFISLSRILNVDKKDIVQFLKDNRNRITIDGNSYYYDNLSQNDIKEYFKPEEINFQEITVHHISSILDKNSFLNEGILNLRKLLLTKNSFTNFLSQYEISIRENYPDTLVLLYKGKEASTDYLTYRFKKDRCINGFLFCESALIDSNVSHIRECPELVSHIGREIIGSSDLEKYWKLQGVPSLVSFNVPVNQIHWTTFNGHLELNDQRMYLIFKALEFLLFKYCHYPIENKMIFLEENYDVPPEDIIKVAELDSSV